MTFSGQYKKYQDQVEHFLTQYFPQKMPSSTLTNAMNYSLLLGGKRVRPVLTLATCEMLGASATTALPAACALEMIHTYSLIHDDLPAMDDDDLRRGKPSNHKVYGEAIAILAGDGLLTESFVALSHPDWNLDAQAKLKIIDYVARCSGALGMVAGQVLDLENEGKDCNQSQLEHIHFHKTGRLMTASIVVGALAAGASEAAVKDLETVGQKLGLAFQIADDVLDITASTETLGKNANSDLKKNKSTYPSIIGLEPSKAKASELLNESMSILESFGDKASFLKELAHFIVHRPS